MPVGELGESKEEFISFPQTNCHSSIISDIGSKNFCALCTHPLSYHYHSMKELIMKIFLSIPNSQRQLMFISD